jgi:xanthine dehydrogenase YagS FAD-binding subunit
MNPDTIAEAAAAGTPVADAMQDAPGHAAVLKAGGIDLLDLMKENLLAPRQIVNLRVLPGLDQIVEEAGGGLTLGPLVTLAALARHPLVRLRYTALSEAVENAASPQIRNIASLGGNILQRPRCWYFRSVLHPCRRKGGACCYALLGENQYHAVFDNDACAIVHPSTAATALVALHAGITLTDARGRHREPPLERFFVAPETDIGRENDLRPGEVLTAIHLPPVADNARSVHVKLCEKDSFDWPIADVAVVIASGQDRRCTGASIVLGGAAPVPHRARAAEAVLMGSIIDASVAEAAGRAALNGATPLAKNAYKLPILATLVRRAVMKAATGAT